MKENIKQEQEEKPGRSKLEHYLRRALILFVLIILLFLFIIGTFIPDTVL